MMELNLMDYLTLSAGIFFLMQFINVVLSTMKTILTVKANKHVAMLINTITYTFYSGVVKLLTEQPMAIVLAVTFLTNMIGVYLALYILEKTRKDVLWKVEVTVQNEVAEELHNRMTDVPHSYIEVGKNTLFNFYCDTQKESAKVKEIVKHYNAKYFVAESKAL
jgi:uncharacterized protein YebE (UPF0316 family)